MLTLIFVVLFQVQVATPATDSPTAIGLVETAAKYSNYLMAIVGFIIAIVLLKTGLPDKISAYWEKLSGMQDKERGILERELAKAKSDLERVEHESTAKDNQLIDLTRELDLRRAINKQDTDAIALLKQDKSNDEIIISRLRQEIREFERGAQSSDGTK